MQSGVIRLLLHSEGVCIRACVAADFDLQTQASHGHSRQILSDICNAAFARQDTCKRKFLICQHLPQRSLPGARAARESMHFPIMGGSQKIVALEQLIERSLRARTKVSRELSFAFGLLARAHLGEDLLQALGRLGAVVAHHA